MHEQESIIMQNQEKTIFFFKLMEVISDYINVRATLPQFMKKKESFRKKKYQSRLWRSNL